MSTQVNTTENHALVKMDLGTVQGFEALQRAARMLCSSTLVPKQYQGTAGLANCVIALNMASRLNADPLMVIQNLYIVHGRPGWSAKFLIATFNQSGKYSALRFEEKGKEGSDDWGMRATAIELKTGERLTGPWIDIKLAKANGWFAKEGSKWLVMPEQMLRYRAAAWFINTMAPELSMGLQTREEIEDRDTLTASGDASWPEITPEAAPDPQAPEVAAEVIPPPQTSAQEPGIVQATPAPTPETKPQTSRTADLKSRL